MRRVVLLAFLVVFVASPASAATLTVGDGQQYQSIQGAIDNATDGDTIEITEGVYNERIDIDKNLTLVGQDNVTVNASQRTVRFSSENITLRNIEIQQDLNREISPGLPGPAVVIDQNMSHLEMENVHFDVDSTDDYITGHMKGQFTFEPYNVHVDRLSMHNTTVDTESKVDPVIVGLTVRDLDIVNYTSNVSQTGNSHFRIYPYQNQDSDFLFDNIDIEQEDKFEEQTYIIRLDEGDDLNLTVKNSSLGDKLIEIEKDERRDEMGHLTNLVVQNTSIDTYSNPDTSHNVGIVTLTHTQNDYNISFMNVSSSNSERALVTTITEGFRIKPTVTNQVNLSVLKSTVVQGKIIESRSTHTDNITRFNDVSVRDTTGIVMDSLYGKYDSDNDVVDNITVEDSELNVISVMMVSNTSNHSVDVDIINSNLTVRRKLAMKDFKIEGIDVDGDWRFVDSQVKPFVYDYEQGVSSDFNKIMFINSTLSHDTDLENVTFRDSTTNASIKISGRYINSTSQGLVILRDGIVTGSSGNFQSNGGYIGINNVSVVTVGGSSGVINASQNISVDPFTIIPDRGNVSNVSINSTYLVWESVSNGTLVWADVDNPVLIDEQSADSPEEYDNGTHQVFYGSTENMSGDTSPDNQVDVPGTDETFDIEIPLIGIVVLCLLGTGYLVRKN